MWGTVIVIIQGNLGKYLQDLVLVSLKVLILTTEFNIYININIDYDDLYKDPYNITMDMGND